MLLVYLIFVKLNKVYLLNMFEKSLISCFNLG